jgi:hypothetical protein
MCLVEQFAANQPDSRTNVSIRDWIVGDRQLVLDRFGGADRFLLAGLLLAHAHGFLPSWEGAKTYIYHGLFVAV